MATIKVQDTEFYYELYGKGKPLVLISGYTCDHSFYFPVLEKLAQQFQMLVFDNQGIGQTRDQSEVLSAELMAHNIMALIKALDLHKPHIVGQSMGGTLAQALASQYPDAIDKLVLLTTVAKWRQAMLGGLGSLLKLREQQVDFDVLFAASLPWIFGEDFLCNTAQVEALKQAILSNPYPQSLHDQTRQFKVLEQFNSTEYLSAITAPTLLIAGKEDLLALPSEMEFLQQRITNSKLLCLDCGHDLPHERPEQLASALLGFLA